MFVVVGRPLRSMLVHKSAIFRGLNTLVIHLVPKATKTIRRRIAWAFVPTRSYHALDITYIRIELFSKIICSGILQQWYSLLCYLIRLRLLYGRCMLHALFETFGLFYRIWRRMRDVSDYDLESGSTVAVEYDSNILVSCRRRSKESRRTVSAMVTWTDLDILTFDTTEQLLPSIINTFNNAFLPIKKDIFSNFFHQKIPILHRYVDSYNSWLVVFNFSKYFVMLVLNNSSYHFLS